MDNMGRQMGELHRLYGRSIGYSLGMFDLSRHASWIEGGKRALSLKMSSDTDWPGL